MVACLLAVVASPGRLVIPIRPWPAAESPLAIQSAMPTFWPLREGFRSNMPQRRPLEEGFVSRMPDLGPGRRDVPNLPRVR
jgi:hypothetical protein